MARAGGLEDRAHPRALARRVAAEVEDDAGAETEEVDGERRDHAADLARRLDVVGEVADRRGELQ
jgi:hypothetical protein